MLVSTRPRAVVAMLGLLLASALAGCASTVPVENIHGSAVPSGNSLDDVYAAIVEGARIRGWKIEKVEPGHALGTLFVRSHVARVDIYYSTDSYSIEYKDSDNLEYADGRIHRNYNKWVENLNGDIEHALTY